MGHMKFIQRRINVAATSWRCINIDTTLFQRCVPAGISCAVKDPTTEINLLLYIHYAKLAPCGQWLNTTDRSSGKKKMKEKIKGKDNIKVSVPSRNALQWVNFGCKFDQNRFKTRKLQG